MGNWLVDGDLELFHVMPLRDKTREKVRKHREEGNRR